MVLPGHLAGGYIATRALLALTHPGFSAYEIDSLLILGTLAGEGPDIDLIRFYFEHAKKDPKVFDHRDYVTHTPLFWLCVLIIVGGLGLIVHSSLAVYAGLVILLGAWSHLLLDSIEHGVRWLFPYSNRKFFLITQKPEAPNPARPGTIPYYWNHLRHNYLTTFTFYAEVVLTVAALFLVFWR